MSALAFAAVSSPRWLRSIGKAERLCVGLISGTSADAAEAVLCRITGTGASVELKLLQHLSLPFDSGLATRILELTSVAQLSELNFELGHKFADAALAVIAQAG